MIAIQDFDWDEGLLHAVKRNGQPRVQVYRASQVAVVMGRGSKPEMEVNIDAALDDGVPLLRRRGGGCSVVLDTGNVIVSCVLPLSGLGDTSRAFSTITNWLIGALKHVGIPNIRQEGISDLALGDRKIGGACIYRTKGLLYYSTTLLFQPDLDLVERYLKHPPREPRYRAGRSHRAFMGSLTESTSTLTDDINVFTEQMGRRLSETLETLWVLESFIGQKREVLA